MAARTLATLASRRGDPEVAAAAWATAAEAAAATVELHATREGRLAAIREYGDTFHAAAYSLAGAGRLARAVEIVELGRARELATWLERDLVDIDQLWHADPELCERFLGLRQRIDALQHRGAESADIVMATAVEALADTVLDIRRLPGLSGFLRRPQLSDLVAAPAGDTVAYPVIAPTGSCWLVLRARADEPVTCIELPDVTSARVRALFLRRDPSRSEMAGYLPAHRRTPVLDAAITEVGALLGPGLLQPLHEHLVGDGADEVCLVPLGLLGLLPLHALTWSDTNGATRCLLDDLVVAYAPSGFARLTCRRRAQQRIASRKLVAVGNPLPHSKPLRHSEREARMVADSMPASETVLLVREAATKQAIVDALPGATHVHLACHGSAALTPQALDAALSLAHHELLSAAEILAVEVGAARLIVASACQSGVIADLRAADEALALSHVFIAAGAAGVIASLWSVADYATALLMTCFYERLADAPGEPARALRAAELWLRDLRHEDERAYLARHPDLRDHQAEHDAARSARATLPPGSNDRRFSAPTLWAGFVFSGA